MTKNTKAENPLLSKKLPRPPSPATAEETTYTPSSGTPPSTPAPQREQLAPVPPTHLSANDAAEEETKITVVLNSEQTEKMTSLKLEYQRLHRKWLSDTELVRRLIESATFESILIPSSQMRKKKRK